MNEIAPGDQRAEVVSTYLLICYAANSLPVLGVGLLSSVIGPSAAHLCFAILIAVLAVTATAIGMRYLPAPDRSGQKIPQRPQQRIASAARAVTAAIRHRAP